jgi:Tfp pilus assembly protein PilO
MASFQCCAAFRIPDEDEMNEVVETLKTVVVVLLGIIVTIVGWFAKRTSDRVDEIKESVVTRAELATTLAFIREDRLAQHKENREALARIETKIDANEERSSLTRHDTNESVHALALQVAVLTKHNRTHER